MQPPAQELVARDLHDNIWTFRHIYRGMSILQPWYFTTLIHKVFLLLLFML